MPEAPKWHRAAMSQRQFLVTHAHGYVAHGALLQRIAAMAIGASLMPNRWHSEHFPHDGGKPPIGHLRLRHSCGSASSLPVRSSRSGPRQLTMFLQLAKGLYIIDLKVISKEEVLKEIIEVNKIMII